MIPPHLRHALPLAMLVAGVLLVAEAGMGCKTSSESTNACPEGTYYDLRSGSCIRPVTYEDEAVAGNYERYQGLISSQPNTPILNQVSLNRWISPEDFERLIDDPAIQSIEKLILRLPVTPGGLTVPIELPSGTPTSSALTVAFEQISQYFGSMTLATGDTLDRYLPELKAARSYSIGVFRYSSPSPAAALSWWTTQRSIVRVSQPMATELEKGQEPLVPGQVLK